MSKCCTINVLVSCFTVDFGGSFHCGANMTEDGV